MSSIRRPGVGSIPSLEAANQAQIEDLVQRNRTLEHINKKLQQEVAQEKTRSAEAVSTIQKQWESNKQQWKEAVDDVIAAQRIVEKQLEVELEKERGVVIKEMEVTRQEKMLRLHRDYKIKQFQMREEELERKIDEMEEENANLKEDYEDHSRAQRQQVEEYVALLKEAKHALTRVTKEKAEKESKLNKLLEKQSNLEAQSGSMESKLQRLQLQLESSQTKIANLDTTNDELRRKNTDLSRQVERWQNLETKGGEEVEKEHKKRVDLELKLRELQEEYDKQQEQHEADLEREKRRTEKVKVTVTGWETEAKNMEKEAQEAQKQVRKLERQLEKLKAELEVERARVRPPSPVKQSRTVASPVEDEIEDVEELEFEPPRKEKEISSKQRSESNDTTKAGSSTAKAPTSFPLRQVARKSTGGKPPPPRKSVSIDNGEIEEIPDPSKSRKRKGKEKAVEDNIEEEQEEEEQEAPVEKKKRKRKTAAEVKDEVEIVEKSKKKSTSEQPAGKIKAKGTARAVSKRPNVKSDSVQKQEEPQPQKKKRKIVPASAVPGPFAFGSLAMFDDKMNGLNIPSVLSPVRDEAVPQRSTAASMIGSIGSFASKLRKP